MRAQQFLFAATCLLPMVEGLHFPLITSIGYAWCALPNMSIFPAHACWMLPPWVFAGFVHMQKPLPKRAACVQDT